MNNLEKELAEKFMYAIHIKNNKNILETYCNYIKHITILKDKKDKSLLNKVNDMYREYFKDRKSVV